VLEADCGQQALRRTDEHVPSVVLVDHRLPDMSGLDVLAQLRTYSPSRHIPVILMSGVAHQLSDVDHGADRVLSKPFDITDFVEQINAVACDVRDGVAYPNATCQRSPDRITVR